MSRAALQASNTTIQTLPANASINIGTIKLRFGRDIILENGSIGIKTCGYYDINETITVQPTAIGEVSVKLQHNGVDIPGAIAYGYATEASQPVTLNLNSIIRVKANCGYPCEAIPDTVTAILVDGAGDVVSVLASVTKL